MPPHTSDLCPLHVPGGTSRSSGHRWKRYFLPVALAASILLLPGGAVEAEAAQTRQARPAPAAQKQQASRASSPTVRKGLAQRRGSRDRERQARPTPQPSAAAKPDPEVINGALQRAALATGLNAGVLRRIAERESRLNPAAANPFSSARGLMQFTRDTWLEVVRDFGPRHGLSQQAQALTTDRDGKIGARNWQELQGILRLRDDPHLSAVLAAERLKKARPALEQAQGRTASPADLYLVHLLGPTGARQFLAAVRETPSRSSLAIVGNAAKPNPGVFERSGRPLPVSKVYEEVAEMFEPHATATAEVAQDAAHIAVAEADR
ncbi:lytic transglycosylase domain-containing protein [Pseudoroseomonas wenyumeiae]|uniref:Lytic transglycosylase domain-containing protein n=1 Tax=Teichococcus wenyumeiae TaxID=2478470 RepID=A0A3A9J6B2_9PROT|nr:lytic transglycosylase domain-containing protein [Pseudoroseomonas wenyumeiae]RMI19864.1 lytic transglycosylase domain-containing protein [Pseudoroseomonas wenyumeiae]